MMTRCEWGECGEPAVEVVWYPKRIPGSVHRCSSVGKEPLCCCAACAVVAREEVEDILARHEVRRCGCHVLSEEESKQVAADERSDALRDDRAQGVRTR